MTDNHIILQRLIRMRAIVADLKNLVDVKYYGDRRLFEVVDESIWNRDIVGGLADYLRSVCNDLKHVCALPPDHIAYDIKRLMAFCNALRDTQ